MCKTFIVSAINSNLAGRVVPQPLPEIFILLFARTQRNDISARREDLTRYLHHQIYSFLRGQARYICKDRAFELDGKGEFLQKLSLAVPLTFHVVNTEVVRKFRVRLRVPDIIVNAIRDPDQPAGTLSYQPIEAIAVLGQLNLHCVPA